VSATALRLHATTLVQSGPASRQNSGKRSTPPGLSFADVNPQSITQDRLPDFLAWLSQRSHLFRGALLNTCLRDDGYYFSQMGTFVERADNTARILEHPILGAAAGQRHHRRRQFRTVSMVGDPPRSCRAAGVTVSPTQTPQLKAFNIAEFLILRREMPRSLAYCYDWLADTAEDLGQFYGSREPSLDLAADIFKDLKEKQMRDIYQEGLHDFLIDFIGKNNQFAHQLCEDYNFA
jgi:uncharacterized alpha-E superfamily protein